MEYARDVEEGILLPVERQAGERAGSQELVRTGRKVEGGMPQGMQGRHAPGGYVSPQDGALPGAPGARPDIPETAFGMPEEPFETLKREPFAEPQPVTPGPPPLLSAEELNAQNFYERLGVAPDADGEALKRARQQKGKLFHPDLNRDIDTNAQMKSINEAYDALKDEKARVAYDATLKQSGMSRNAASEMSAAEAVKQKSPPAPSVAAEADTAKGSGVWDGLKHEAKKAAKIEAEDYALEKIAGEEEEEEPGPILDLKSGNGNVRQFPRRPEEDEFEKAA